MLREWQDRVVITGLLLGFGPGAALGAGRFAYALVLPAMQAELGLTFAQAGLLGSANTVGYLLGALVSHRVLAAVGYRLGFYASLIIASATLLLLALSLRLLTPALRAVSVRGRSTTSQSTRWMILLGLPTRCSGVSL